MTSRSFIATAENVDVSPMTPNTPLAVSTPIASREVVGSHAAGDVATAVGAVEPVAPTGEPQAVAITIRASATRMLPVHRRPGPVPRLGLRRSLDPVDRSGQRDVGVGQPVRDMCREDDPDGLVALEMDIRMVVRRIRGLGHPIDEGHGGLKALQREGLRQSIAALPGPAGPRREQGSEGGLVESRLVLLRRHASEPSLYAFRTRRMNLGYPDHTKTL